MVAVLKLKLGRYRVKAEVMSPDTTSVTASTESKSLVGIEVPKSCLKILSLSTVPITERTLLAQILLWSVVEETLPNSLIVNGREIPTGRNCEFAIISS
jgi:hypothetical protein